MFPPQDVLVHTGGWCGHQEPEVDPSITLLRRLAITLRDRAIRTVAAQAQDRRRTWLTCWLVEELPPGRLIELKHGERRFGSSNRKAIVVNPAVHRYGIGMPLYKNAADHSLCALRLTEV